MRSDERESLTTDERSAAEDAKSSRPLLPGQMTEAASLSLYLLVPAALLAVTLFGGLRFAAADGAFIFLKPPLICLVLAALTMLLFVRSGMIDIGAWLDLSHPGPAKAAHGSILFTLFTATTQVYNSLMPESGILFWLIGFCFLWTLWTNLFAELDARKVLRSVAAVFAMAFAVKYLVLANITAAPTGSWWRRLIEDPGKEAVTWLLDLPQYGAATGYVQFFTLATFLLALFLLPRRPNRQSTAAGR